MTDLATQGDTATAIFVNEGVSQPARLIRSADGRWRIDCCAGSQLDRQPRVSYRVPSSGMEPTLKVGQIVTSDNAAMRAHPPSLDANVVFHPPRGDAGAISACRDKREGAGHLQACGRPMSQMSAQTFIKRVVGLPGDRMAIIDGHVIRDGVGEGDSYVAPCGSDPSCNVPKAVVIPPADYFLLGDERGASDDSRFWGPVHRSWIVGLVRR